VNPWSGADADRDGERMERELFAGRARALGPAAIPSLASVLRAAETSRETRAARSAHGRAFMAMMLAAACMTAAITKLPTAATTGAIAPDVDASAPRAASAYETAAAATCTLDDELLVSEESACFAPAPLFTAAPAVAASLAPPPTCSADESCAISAP
jgi:hypothetical protein